MLKCVVQPSASSLQSSQKFTEYLKTFKCTASGLTHFVLSFCNHAVISLPRLSLAISNMAIKSLTLISLVKTYWLQIMDAWMEMVKKVNREYLSLKCQNMEVKNIWKLT